MSKQETGCITMSESNIRLNENTFTAWQEIRYNNFLIGAEEVAACSSEYDRTVLQEFARQAPSESDGFQLTQKINGIVTINGADIPVSSDMAVSAVYFIDATVIPVHMYTKHHATGRSVDQDVIDSTVQPIQTRNGRIVFLEKSSYEFHLIRTTNDPYLEETQEFTYV